MTNREIINKTAEFMKSKFAKDHTGHDWWHLFRVWTLSKHIAAREKKADMLVVELAALLHDISDHKKHGGDSEPGARAAKKWLHGLGVDDKTTEHVADIIRHISFKSPNQKNELKTIEGKIVHDADKLDAMGAIGIARCMVFGGAVGRLIYSPDIPMMKDYAFEKANNENSTAIHHFYEKLLFLKERMFTKTGKQMAIRRHKFMETYLKEFYAEWDGKH